MLTLYGVSVNAENARHLVASLFADGSADALDAAETIAYAVSSGFPRGSGSAGDGDAILAVLEDPPAGLENLRGALARDQRDRLEDRE